MIFLFLALSVFANVCSSHHNTNASLMLRKLTLKITLRAIRPFLVLVLQASQHADLNLWTVLQSQKKANTQLFIYNHSEFMKALVIGVLTACASARACGTICADVARTVAQLSARDSKRCPEAGST